MLAVMLAGTLVTTAMEANAQQLRCSPSEEETVPTRQGAVGVWLLPIAGHLQHIVMDEAKQFVDLNA
jgi:hypothetical protein